MVHIDMMSNADEDTLAMTWIAFRVAEIVEACMLNLKMPGLGGRDLVGPKQRMKVFVKRRPWPEARNYSHQPIVLNNIDLGFRLKTLRTALESSKRNEPLAFAEYCYTVRHSDEWILCFILV